MVLSISLLVLITISGVTDSQFHYVTYTRSYICTVEGSSVTLGCSHSYPSDYIKYIVWTNKLMTFNVIPFDLTKDPEYQNRAEYTGDWRYDCSIKLSNVMKQDQGQYSFIIIPRFGNMIHEGGVQLSVTDFQVERPEKVMEGNTVTLTCKTTCMLTELLTFAWYMDGDYFPTYTTDTNELHLDAVSRKNYGSYSCGVQSSQSRSSSVTLNIQSQELTVSISVIPDGDILEGSEVTLSCNCEGDPPAIHIIWYKGSTDTYLGRTFTLNNISRADSGEYRCQCYNTFEDISKSVTLNVQYPPKGVSVLLSPTGDIMEGSLVILTCSGDSNPQVRDYTWLKGASIKGYGQTYTIKNVGIDNSGEYKCRAGNDHGQSSSAAMILDVKYPPKSVWASVIPSSEVTEGSLVTFTCKSDANPPVDDYTWYKKKVVQGEERTFTLSQVSIKDSGKYWCEAKNQYGEKTSNMATLNVLTQRNNVSVLVYPTGDIMEGVSVTLTCSCGADASAAEYAWYKGSIRKGFGRTYAFHKIGSNDSGEYKCQGEDGRGDWFSITVHLDVKYPPKSVSVSVSPSGDITTGSMVLLTCSSDANPPTSSRNYTWYKAGVHIARGRSMRFSHFGLEDDGEYECKSENAYGAKLSEPVALLLSYLPRSIMVSASPSSEVKEGEQVTLSCSADANPPARDYTWYKGTVKKGMGKTYSINRTSSADTGDYKCQVANEHGRMFSPSLRLNVLYPPKFIRVSVWPFGEVEEGASVNLICSADANPSVHDYTWYRGNALLGTGSTYSILNVSHDDGGKYECKSGNEHGEKVGHVTLNILYGPKNLWVSVNPAGGVTPGGLVTLTCSAEANPPVLYYTWFTQGETSPLKFGQSYSFTFNPETSGRYFCQAQNTYGSGVSPPVMISSDELSSTGRTVYVVVGSVCAGVAALVVLLVCMRGKRQKWNQHEYVNTDARGHTPLNNLSRPPMNTVNVPARFQPRCNEGPYTSLDPRTICPDYATLVTMGNRH